MRSFCARRVLELENFYPSSTKSQFAAPHDVDENSLDTKKIRREKNPQN